MQESNSATTAGPAPPFQAVKATANRNNGTSTLRTWKPPMRSAALIAAKTERTARPYPCIVERCGMGRRWTIRLGLFRIGRDGGEQHDQSLRHSGMSKYGIS